MKLLKLNQAMRCAFLDEKGRQCSKIVRTAERYHLDPELYNGPRWLKVPICQDHAKKLGP